MSACIGNVIDLMSDDDSKVEEIISSPEKQESPPHRKKRQPFSPLNGRDLRKARTNDVNKGKEDPRYHMRRILHDQDDCISTYLFSTYKKKTISFHGVPPCHSSTPIVTDLAIRQRIFENQVGRALDATDDIARLLSRFMRNFIFLQGEPSKNAESGEYHTPHDQSWSRSSCQLHTDSKFLFRSDLGPSRYDHPIAYNTAENRKILADILSFVGNLTFKLGREKENAFRIHCIRYTRGNGMGKHADYFGIRLAASGGYRVRLCISIGEPRVITFSATLVKKGQIDREGSVCPGLGFQMTTRGGVDAYIMTSHGNGGCFLFFTNNKMDVAVQAQHSVKRLSEGGGSAVMVVDFMVATYADALRAVMRLRATTISL